MSRKHISVIGAFAGAPTDPACRSRGALAALLTLTLFAATLRAVEIGTAPLWFDEGFSAWFPRQSWRYLWAVSPNYETHPPLYYMMLKLWREAFGESEIALRAMSATISVATVAAGFAAGWVLGGARRGLALGSLAALALTVADLQLLHGREARSYPLLALAMALTLIAALTILCAETRERDNGGPGAPTWSYPALGASMALLMWTHNIGVAAAGAVGMFMAIWWAAQSRRRSTFLGLSGAALTMAALYAPYVPKLALQMQGVGGDFWIEAPTLRGVASVTLDGYGLLSNGIARWADAVVMAATLLLGALGLWRLCEGARAGFWLIMVAAAAPWIVAITVTLLGRPIFLPRVLIHAQPAAALVIAAVPWALPRGWRPTATVCLIVLALTAGVANTVRNPPHLRPWRIIVETIAADLRRDAPVLVLPSGSALTLEYYNRVEAAGLDLRPLPAPYPTRTHWDTGPRGLSAAQLAQAIDSIRDEEWIWIITRRLDLVDANSAFRTAIEVLFPCRATLLDGGDRGLTVTKRAKGDDCPAVLR